MDCFTRTFPKKSILQETIKRSYQQQGIVRFEYSKFSAILMIVTVFFTLPWWWWCWKVSANSCMISRNNQFILYTLEELPITKLKNILTLILTCYRCVHIDVFAIYSILWSITYWWVTWCADVKSGSEDSMGSKLLLCIQFGCYLSEGIWILQCIMWLSYIRIYDLPLLAMAVSWLRIVLGFFPL